MYRLRSFHVRVLGFNNFSLQPACQLDEIDGGWLDFHCVSSSIYNNHACVTRHYPSRLGHLDVVGDPTESMHTSGLIIIFAYRKSCMKTC